VITAIGVPRCWPATSRTSSRPSAVGQAHVGQHQRVRVLAEQRARLAHGGGAVDVQAHLDQGDLEQLAQVGFVVDHQDAGRMLMLSI
jgi:hypothetical protein